MSSRTAKTPAPTPTPAYATIAEAAAFTRLGKSTLWRHIDAGKLKAHRVGARVLIAYDELNEFIRAKPAR